MLQSDEGINKGKKTLLLEKKKSQSPQELTNIELVKTY